MNRGTLVGGFTGETIPERTFESENEAKRWYQAVKRQGAWWGYEQCIEDASGVVTYTLTVVQGSI